ncbi:uncharacterized protein LOC121376411 [Gigantopelta aegis]|uniref:uncharacterized protein LOC121376411 n=1 Tax=Gigantopelta aegis TaxID=1735272 RepID=UPI001B8890E9|nr:uncharacterized protein LOC121376411 [Gigantopelta aegis]
MKGNMVLHTRDIMVPENGITAAIDQYASSASLKDLGLVKDVLGSLVESKTQVDAIRYAFQNLTTPSLVDFCIVALQVTRDANVQYGIEECFMEFSMQSLETYCILLEKGMHLGEIWPLWTYSLVMPQAEKHIFDAMILRREACNVMVVHHFIAGKKHRDAYKVLIATIQACNAQSFRVLLYVMREFPPDPLKQTPFRMIFRTLVLAGYKPDQDFVSGLTGVGYKKRYFGNFTPLGIWYRNYAKTVKNLTHLCRIAVRKQFTYNVFYSVNKLKIPEKLKQYILLRDHHTESVIYSQKG